jgi:hypothetical protein
VHAGFVTAETLATTLDVRPVAEVAGDSHPVAANADQQSAVRVALSRVPS